MPEALHSRRWIRHLVYRTEITRTTWRFRAALAVLIVALVWATSGWWMRSVARSLVCDANMAPSDAILAENFDLDYLVLERAGELRRMGLAPRILVPVTADGRTLQPSDVALGTTTVVANIARVGKMDIVPFVQEEPISLNAARDVLRFARREQIRSLIVVAPYFRSQRSFLVYSSTLGHEGIEIRCEPVRGIHAIDSWGSSLHGVQNVVEQWLKLQYYRLYVLPFRSQS